MHKATITLCSILLLVALGCSSKETTGVLSHDDYISSAEKKLDTLERKANKLSGEKSTRIHADIADTRAEISILRTTSDAGWDTRRAGVERRLDRINEELDRARAE